MSFYDEMAGLSSDMISEFGRDVVVSRADDSGTFDPATGGGTTPVITTQTVKAVRLTLSKGSLGSLSEQYMEDFVRGKLYMMLISGLGPDFKPRSGDTLTMDSEDYEVIGNNVLSPAGTDVLYKVPVRMA